MLRVGAKSAKGACLVFINLMLRLSGIENVKLVSLTCRSSFSLHTVHSLPPLSPGSDSVFHDRFEPVGFPKVPSEGPSSNADPSCEYSDWAEQAFREDMLTSAGLEGGKCGSPVHRISQKSFPFTPMQNWPHSRALLTDCLWCSLILAFGAAHSGSCLPLSCQLHLLLHLHTLPAATAQRMWLLGRSACSCTAAS